MNEKFFPSEPSHTRPKSTTLTGSTRLPPPRNKHTFRADPKVSSVEAAQAWEDLEAETGFASYAAYLKSLEDNPAYQETSWLEFLGDEEGSPYDCKNHCTIIDLFNEEASPPKANLRCEKLSADQTLQSLRTPSKDIKVQIVLWSIDEISDQTMDPEFVTVFGLGLKLDPHFFGALAAKSGGEIFIEPSVDEGALREYLFLDGSVVAIARDCPLAKPNGPPILLIATFRRLDYHIDTSTLYYSMREAPPARHVQGVRIYAGDPILYTRLLTLSINQNPDCTISCEALLFGSLLPLLQLDILRMRARFSHVRATFQEQKVRAIESVVMEIDHPSRRELFDDDTVDARLYRHREFLRSLIVTFEGFKEPLVRFITSQLGPELTTAPAYHRNAEERGSIVKEALSLEAEIRDFLQLKAGQLSLLESRKSIEVSNDQLQEGKRVKIFTILAFVYIPLNLATSIFGMNLQQLNGSGKSVKYFVVTALVALIITGGSWWLTEQWSTLRAWRKRDPDSYKGPVTFKSYAPSARNYSILVRAAMLTWLVAHSHSSWMALSGAGWCTLTNARKRCRHDDDHRRGLFAGDYLSKFICPYYDTNDFTLDRRWW